VSGDGAWGVWRRNGNGGGGTGEALVRGQWEVGRLVCFFLILNLILIELFVSYSLEKRLLENSEKAERAGGTMRRKAQT
jgi:hypothetical protein